MESTILEVVESSLILRPNSYTTCRMGHYQRGEEDRPMQKMMDSGIFSLLSFLLFAAAVPKREIL